MIRDILVIGAGVLGLSSALHIKRLNPEKTVAVIDRLPGPGQGNTAKAAGIYLNLHTTLVNYLMGDSTIDWLYHLQGDLGYQIGLHQYGYLYLLDEGRYEKLKRAIPRARGLGVEVKTYEAEELGRLIPDLTLEFGDEEAGTYTVVLTVSDDEGETDTASASVKVEGVPAGVGGIPGFPIASVAIGALLGALILSRLSAPHRREMI